MDLKELYKKWCKETKRSGGVLVGSSIQEFLEYAQAEIDKPKINTEHGQHVCAYDMSGSCMWCGHKLWVQTFG